VEGIRTSIVPEEFYSRVEEIVDVLHKLNGLTMVKHRSTIDICSTMGDLIAPKLGRTLAELTLRKYVYRDTGEVVLERSLEEPLPEDFGTPIEYIVFAMGLVCLEFIRQSSRIHDDSSWTDLFKGILYEYLAHEERSPIPVLGHLYDLEADVRVSETETLNP